MTLLDAAAQLVDAANRVLPPTSRLNWLYLLSTAVLAIAVAVASGHCDPRRRIRSVAHYLLPRSIWLHASAIVDYKVAVIGKMIERFMLAPLLLSSAVVGQWIAGLLAGTGTWGMTLASPWVEIAYTITTLLLADLSFYVVHRLAHRLPALWAFHKVHHSAEVLTPITYLREHPVDQILQLTAAALFVGPATGLFMHLFPDQLTIIKVLGLNVGTFVWFFLLGSNLRHSHVWLSYGRVFDLILSSPAQHQLHHSTDPAHHNRNFGSMFAVWDWAFGTLLAPRERPAALRFGLDGAELGDYRTLSDFYFRPFRNVVAMTRGAPAAVSAQTADSR